MHDDLELRRPRCLERLDRPGIRLVDRLDEGARQETEAFEEQRQKASEFRLLEGEEKDEAPRDSRDIAEHRRKRTDDHLDRAADPRYARGDDSQNERDDCGERACGDGIQDGHSERRGYLSHLVERFGVRHELLDEPHEAAGEILGRIKEAEIDVATRDEGHREEGDEDARIGRVPFREEQRVGRRLPLACERFASRLATSASALLEKSHQQHSAVELEGSSSP